jgi:hypothetical protein
MNCFRSSRKCRKGQKCGDRLCVDFQAGRKIKLENLMLILMGVRWDG